MGKLARGLLVLFVSCQVGCAGTSAALSGRRPLEVSMEARKQLRGDEEQAVMPGQRLHDGDLLSLTLRGDGPAHVYIVHTSQVEPSAVLIPRATESAPQLQPGVPLRVPGQDWFHVTGVPGKEQLVAVVSAAPLERAEVLRRASLPQDLERSAPPPVSADRDRCRGDRCGGGALVTHADKSGVAVLSYPFELASGPN